MTIPPITSRMSKTSVGNTSSWLLTCHGCGNMVEVPNAAVGVIYTCAICHAGMEVVDGERGITRAPLAVATRPSSPIPSSAAPAIGTHLAGFEVIASLDADVHGRRFRVRGPDGNTFRALIVDRALAKEPAFAERIEAQLAACRQLRSPVILPVERCLRIDQSVMYLSQDPPGFESLATILLRDHTLAQAMALSIIRQLAAALDEAAGQGLTHGWLRPEVVLINADGVLRLDELGVPKAHEFLLKKIKGSTDSTAHYLAPDHLNPAQASDAKADIFMLGALFFRMLTGEALVVGSSAHEALTRIAADGVPSLSSVMPGVHANIDMFFMYLASVDRRERFNRFGEIVDRSKNLDGSTRRVTRTSEESTAVRVRPPRTPIESFSVEAARPKTSVVRRSGSSEITRFGAQEMAQVGSAEIQRPGTQAHRKTGTEVATQHEGGASRPGTSRLPSSTRALPPPPAAPQSSKPTTTRTRKAVKSRARKKRSAFSPAMIVAIVVLLVLVAVVVTWLVARAQ